MSKTESIYQQAVRLGLDIERHESDLYLRKSEKSVALVDAYAHRANVRQFVAPDDSLWFDIPFAFDPFWAGKEGAAK